MRARELSDDPFARLLGRGRGATAADTVLSSAPTEAARADLAHYREEMASGDLDSTLLLLREHRALIGSRPLLTALAADCARAVMGDAVGQLEPATRRFLDESQLWPSTAGQLMLATSTQSDDGAVSDQVLHVWPEGVRFGPLGCLGDYQTETACGLTVERTNWIRATRGSWQAGETVNAEGDLEPAPWKTCDVCEAQAPDSARAAIEEPQRYMAFEPALHRKLLGHVAEKMLAQVQAKGFSDREALGTVAAETYQRGLLPSAVAQAVGRGEAPVQWVLGARSWKMLRKGHGEPLHTLLFKDDWKRLLAPLVPELEGTTVVAADEAELKGLSRQVAQLLSERTGVAL